MRRLSLLMAVGLSAVAMVVVLAPSGSAQAPPGRTLTFFEPDEGGTFKFVDTPPRSPSRNPESRRFRFSVGDSVLFTSRVLDRRGGTRVGTVYGRFTVLKGRNFENADFLLDGAIRLRDGQLILAGHLRFEEDIAPLAVVGGAGAYEGARGQLTTRDVQGGSEDTVHLLP